MVDIDSVRVNELIQLRVAREFGFRPEVGMNLLRAAPQIYGSTQDPDTSIICDKGKENHSDPKTQGSTRKQGNAVEEEQRTKAQLMDLIPHYRLFNRSRKGHLTVGGSAPDVKLARLPAPGAVVQSLPVEWCHLADLTQSAAAVGKMLVVVAGSFT